MVRVPGKGAALLLGAALALTACGGGDSADTEKTATGNGGGGEECTVERVGGKVTMALGSQPSGLDPLVINGTPSTGGMEIAQMYDTLMQYDPTTGEYEPRVAESLEPNAAFDEWTLKLRPDVTFGNGDPLTADAVISSITRFQSEENRGTYRNLALQIENMKKVDERTVVFTLKAPWATFPFAMANTPGMIVNTKIADERGAGFLTNPTGAGVGPYEFVSFTPKEEIVLKAKQDYWAGPVCIQDIRFVPLATDSGKYEAFQAGELQAAWLRDPLVVDQTGKDDVEGVTNYQNAANVLLLNSGVRGADTAAKDLRVRQAIAHAVDVDAVDQRANEGTGFATSAILGKKSAFYGEADGPKFDRAQASELLAEAKSDGYDGKLAMTCAKSSEESALAIEAQLEAAGFDVQLDLLPDTSALVDRVIVKADYDVSCWGFNAIDEGLWTTLTNSLSSTSKSNYGGFSDPKVDAVLEKLRLASTPDEIRATMKELQEAWNASIPALILNAAANKTIHVPELKNLQATSNSLVFFGDAYLD